MASRGATSTGKQTTTTTNLFAALPSVDGRVSHSSAKKKPKAVPDKTPDVTVGTSTLDPTLLARVRAAAHALGGDATLHLTDKDIEKGYEVLWDAGEGYDMPEHIAIQSIAIKRTPATAATAAPIHSTPALDDAPVSSHAASAVSCVEKMSGKGTSHPTASSTHSNAAADAHAATASGVSMRPMNGGPPGGAAARASYPSPPPTSDVDNDKLIHTLETAAALPPHQLIDVLSTLTGWCLRAAVHPQGDQRAVFFASKALELLCVSLFSVDTDTIATFVYESEAHGLRHGGEGLLMALADFLQALLLPAGKAAVHDVSPPLVTPPAPSLAQALLSLCATSQRLSDTESGADLREQVAVAVVALIRHSVQVAAAANVAAHDMSALSHKLESLRSVFARELHALDTTAPTTSSSTLKLRLRYRDLAHEAAATALAGLEAAVAGCRQVVTGSGSHSLPSVSSLLSQTAAMIAPAAGASGQAARVAESSLRSQLEGIGGEVEASLGPIQANLSQLSRRDAELQEERERLLQLLQANSDNLQAVAAEQHAQAALIESIAARYAPRVDALNARLQSATAVLLSADVATHIEAGVAAASSALSTATSTALLTASAAWGGSAAHEVPTPTPTADMSGVVLATLETVMINAAAYLEQERRLLQSIESRASQSREEATALLNEAAKYRSLGLAHLADQQAARAATATSFAADDESSVALLRQAAAGTCEELCKALSAPVETGSGSLIGVTKDVIDASPLSSLRNTFQHTSTGSGSGGSNGAPQTVADLLPGDLLALAYVCRDVATQCGVVWGPCKLPPLQPTARPVSADDTLANAVGARSFTQLAHSTRAHAGASTTGTSVKAVDTIVSTASTSTTTGAFAGTNPLHGLRNKIPGKTQAPTHTSTGASTATATATTTGGGARNSLLAGLPQMTPAVAAALQAAGRIPASSTATTSTASTTTASTRGGGSVAVSVSRPPPGLPLPVQSSLTSLTGSPSRRGHMQPQQHAASGGSASPSGVTGGVSSGKLLGAWSHALKHE